MTYTPRPLDTGSASFPPELTPLREKLAAHIHDVWAQRRIAEGWTHGPQRDDQAKEHPCLVPYDDLPEAEKEYDRQTVEQTLRAILALGLEIRRSNGPD